MVTGRLSLVSVLATVALLVSVLYAGLCLADTDSQGERATDCTDSTVVTGHRAAITCRLGRDVRKSRHNIDVQFYPGDSNEPVSVLKCNWLVKRPEKPTCTGYKGCRYNSSFNDTLEIEFSNATKANEGRYICQLVPSDGIPARPCRLNVTDEPVVTAKQPTDSTVTPNTETPAESGSQVNTPAIALGVITLLLAFCNLLMVVTVCRWRIKRQREAVQSKNKDRKSPDEPIASDVEEKRPLGSDTV